MDHETISLLEQLAPDLMKKLTLRATVLERISALQPVGRRALAHRLHMPEREIRSICDALKEDGLISAGTSGMNTTERADGLLPLSRAMTGRSSALGQLEQHLSRMLNVVRVCIVPGDAYADRMEQLGDVGRTAAKQLLRLLSSGTILTVSGGEQMAAIAAALPAAAPVNVKLNIRVLPARGSINSNVETQADTLAARFAQAVGGSYSLLHLPDALPPEALKELVKLPQINEVLHLLRQTDVLIYGVERAEDAVRARSLPSAEVERILRSGVVGEAVGCYFDPAGRMLIHPSGAGLTAEHLSGIGCIVAVAAGAHRAKAMLAAARHHRHELIILDESAARALERLV